MCDTPLTVLVVDDEPSNIDLLKGVLPADCKVKAATSGEKALKIAQKPPYPDLILLDVMMPGMDGYEVCRQLKADAATANIRLVFVSGHCDAEERRKGLLLGAIDFVSKPIDPAVLHALVQMLRQ